MILLLLLGYIGRKHRRQLDVLSRRASIYELRISLVGRILPLDRRCCQHISF